MRVFAFLLLLLLPVAGLAQDTSESDRGYIQGLLEDALSAEGRTVRMEGFAGALSSRATIRKITVTDGEGLWLSASDLALVWNRAALLRGEIAIDEITIGRIELPRPPAPAETAPLPAPEARGAFTLPELPVSVNIAKMAIGRVVLGGALFGEAAEISVSGNANLASGAGTAALRVERLDKAGTFDLAGGFDNTTRVLRLDIDLTEPEDGIVANLVGLSGKPPLALSVKGEGPIADFEAAIRLDTDGQERFAGNVTLLTDAEGATGFTANLGGDLAPLLAPDFAEFLGNEVQLEARGSKATDGALDLDALRLETAALSLEGKATIGADGWPRRLALDAAIVPPEGDRVILPVPGGQSSVAEVVLKGSFDAEAGDAWQIEGRASEAVFGGDRLRSAVFSGSGTLSRAVGSISGTLDLAFDGLAPGDPALARALGDSLHGALGFGWSNGAPLRLRDIAVSGEDYGLAGVLTISAENGVAALTLVPDLKLFIRDLSRFAELAGLDLAGRADLALSGRMEPLTGLANLRFDGTTANLATGIAQLDPLLAGAGTLTLGIVRDETGLRADPLIVGTDHASIEAQANLMSGKGTVTARASVPDLGRALPDLPGPGELTLQANQNGDVWTVETVARLPGEARASYRGMVTGDGTKALAVDGALTAEVGRLSAFAALIGQRISGAARLSAEGRADLLKGSFDVTANSETTGFDPGLPMIAPLLRGEGRLSLAANRSESGLITLDELTFTGPGMNTALSGAMGPGQEGRFDYRLAIANLGQIVPDLPGPASFSGTAERRGSDWRIDASGQGPGGTSLSASGLVVEDGSRANMSLSGRAPLALANARLNGQALSGTASFDFAVNGPLALNSVSGDLRLDGARFAAPEYNVALSGIEGGARLSGGSAQIALQADVSSGGRIGVNGPVSLSAPYGAGLDAELRNVTLRDASLYEVNLGGRVSVNGPLAGGARIAGLIDVETAELKIPQIGPSYSALEGLRHLNPTAEVRRTLRYAGLDGEASSSAAAARAGPAYPLDVTLRAPSRIFVRGRGLDAELGGNLRLTGTTSDIVPVGGFDAIRGRLDLLTRRLDITEGSVRMRGSFDPVISFAATSQVEDVMITLALEGLASAPELTVTSVPELPQEEALSFFLFGRDVTSISAFQAVQLAAAIRTLSGQGGAGLTEKLRQGLGVDDLDIGTDSEGVTEAKVGKYLSDKIYTDVTVKSDGTSQINLNLELSPSVTARGRLGNDGDTGIGIFYERDY